MDTHELQEHTEHAHHSGEKGVGLTTAIVAVLLALATLLGHRAHTEEILTLTQNVDEWDFYQAKHARAYSFALAAETEMLLPNGKDAAVRNFKMSIEEECGAPVPANCTSPLLKRSPLLQQLQAESTPTAAAAPEKAETKSEGGNTSPSAESKEKHEKAGKESSAKEGAIQIHDKAEEEQKEVKLFEQKSDLYDGAELFLEISIVLCSIALLAENKMYWKLSFISTVVGIAVAVWGLLLK